MLKVGVLCGQSDHEVRFVMLFSAPICWFLGDLQLSVLSCPVCVKCSSMCAFVSGQVRGRGHPSRSESEDALYTRASTAEEPADPPRPHGLRHQVHGVLQRELLEEKGCAAGRQRCLISSSHSFSFSFFYTCARVCVVRLLRQHGDRGGGRSHWSDTG